jgi:hypothetical protein
MEEQLRLNILNLEHTINYISRYDETETILAMRACVQEWKKEQRELNTRLRLIHNFLMDVNHLYMQLLKNNFVLQDTTLLVSWCNFPKTLSKILDMMDTPNKHYDIYNLIKKQTPSITKDNIAYIIQLLTTELV